MLRTSAKVDAMPAGPERTRALDHLYQGQSNDCYWHGLFGGIYIGHMRLATYEHLIAAEDLADRAIGALDAAEVRDLDLDGLEDVRLAGPGQVVTVHLTDGGGIGSWDVRAVRHALCAVMRRRPEATTRRCAARGGWPVETSPGGRRRSTRSPTKEPGCRSAHYDQLSVFRAGPVPGARDDPEAWRPHGPSSSVPSGPLRSSCSSPAGWS
jgi:hypothetical protein